MRDTQEHVAQRQSIDAVAGGRSGGQLAAGASPRWLHGTTAGRLWRVYCLQSGALRDGPPIVGSLVRRMQLDGSVQIAIAPPPNASR